MTGVGEHRESPALFRAEALRHQIVSLRFIAGAADAQRFRTAISFPGSGTSNSFAAASTAASASVASTVPSSLAGMWPAK
jgi:hypothetical protein